MLTGLRWRQRQHLQRREGLELWKALAVNWHNHASSALGIRELPQTLIQVQTLIHGLGMESSVGLAKVHTHTWPMLGTGLPSAWEQHPLPHQGAKLPTDSVISYMAITNGEDVQRSSPCWLATPGSSQPCDLILL